MPLLPPIYESSPHMSNMQSVSSHKASVLKSPTSPAFRDPPYSCAEPGYDIFPTDTSTPDTTKPLRTRPMSVYALSEDNVLELIRTIVCLGLPIKSVKSVPAARIQQLFLVHTNDGPRQPLLLALPPPIDVHPLRCERASVTAEATLLAWLGSNTRTNADFILDAYRPRIFQYWSSDSVASRMPMLFTRPCAGTALSELSPPLSAPEKISVDWQAGQLFRRIALHHSPTGKFGYVADVLRDQPSSVHKTPAAHPADHGFDTWTGAFNLLFESVLRDLEDCRVQLSYDTIRRQWRRTSHLLNHVRRPALTSINFYEPKNLMVQPSPNTRSPTPREVTVTGLRDWSNCIFGDPLLSTVFINNPTEPLMSSIDIFISGRPDSLPYGWNGHAYGGNDDSHEEDDSEWEMVEGDVKTSPLNAINEDFAGSPNHDNAQPLIEDPINIPARLALYECYHALCGIAREYHRPRSPGVDKELYWRRRQLDAVAKLEGLVVMDD